MIDRRLDIEHVNPPDHVVYLAEAEVRHVLPHLFRDKEKEIDHVLGLAGEFLAQLRILRGDPDRTSIQMALAQHDATHRHQWCSSEAKFLGAEQCGDHHIAPRLKFAVGLHTDAAAQIVHQQNLLRFRQAQFPGNTGVLD